MKKYIFEWLPVIPIIIIGFIAANFIGTHFLSWKAGYITDYQLASPAINSLKYEDYDVKTDNLRWRNRIKSLGPKEALLEMKLEYADLEDFRVQHAASHIFGALFYNEFGLKGISYCDDAFNFGCYHSFMGTAVSENQNIVDILGEIDRSCAELPSAKVRSGCYHGVGHGILGDLGYDEKFLAEALATCDTMSESGVYNCYAGSFMEYNSRFLLHAPDIFKDGNSRPLGKDLYAPCSSLSRKYLSACYFSQPDWWKIVLNADFNRIGKLCEGVGDKNLKTQCFYGVGKSIAWFNPQNIDRITKICDRMPNKEFVLLCRSQAAVVVRGRTGDASLASQVCEGLAYEDKNFCLEMRGAGNNQRSNVGSNLE